MHSNHIEVYCTCMCVTQVIVAAELLKHAEELVKYKIHPTSIIAGYRLACK